jgi:hypothetical protein
MTKTSNGLLFTDSDELIVSVGASTATGASSPSVQGTAADNAAAVGAPVQTGGVYNSTPPTYSTGDVAVNQVDLNGNKKVVEQYAAAAEDNAIGVFRMEQRFNATLCAADTAVKSSAGFLHGLIITCNDAAPTAGSVIVYNNTAESGTQVFNHTFTTTPFNPLFVMMNCEMGTGIYVGFTTTNDVNVTAIWR